MKRLTSIITLVLLSAAVSAQQAAMQEMLSDTSLTGMSVSICFADAVTGETVFSYDGTRNLAPASVMKLYPTATALSFLGPDYIFSTELLMTGSLNSKKGILDGDLVIKGSGDPALGSPYFEENYGDFIAGWVRTVKARGINHIRGRIAAAPSIYDNNPVPGGWSWADIGNYYGAGVYDINICDNTWKAYVTGYDDGTPATVDSVDYLADGIRVTNYLISSGNSDNGYVYNAPYSYDAWISGTVPVNRSIALKASLPDPPFTLVRLFDRQLREAGVIIDGEPSPARSMECCTEPEVLCVTESPRLSDIVYVTNHESVNLYAEQLRKHLGYMLGGEGSFSAGSDVIENFLVAAGCDPGKTVMLDGSGLSANNNINACMTVRLLVHMHNSGVADAFEASLPEAGKNGTMKNYFRDPFFADRVRAKTGSITSVKSFAGYIITDSGRVLAFAMIANGFSAPYRLVTNHMENLAAEIMKLY